MRSYIIIFFCIILSASCNNNKPKPVHTERDTTITIVNAVSDLFMDSSRLESFISGYNLEDSSAEMMRNFYNSRNYQFAWFNSDGLAEQARAFWNLHNNYLNISKDSSHVDKRLHEQMAILTAEDSSNVSTAKIIETELQLTEHFFQYAQYAYAGKIDPEDLQWHIPRKKVNAMLLLDSLIANKGRNLEEWEPVNQQYKLMYKQLDRYSMIEKAGGWDEIEMGRKKSLRRGDTGIAVLQVKKRLLSVGDYSADTSNIFTDTLLTAVKIVQKRFGYKQDGIINTQLVKALNIPVRERIEQLLINMERMRWMPKEPAGNRILANIPEFKLHVFENSKQVFDMNIVVGTTANRTVIFNDILKYVVFSPYWNVPQSIVRNEILPAMRKNPGYLARKNMEQTGISNGFPVIRQKPGGSNALGRAKFIFPNSYNIYFHDTPSKSLFANETRAFSHGCIRLAEPKKLAEYLLRNQPEWTSDKITEAMNVSKEKWVTLKDPIPVVITYFTSWVSGDGLLNFREDIYGHDVKMKEQLFVESVKTAAN